MAWIIRQPRLIPGHLCRLIYTSIILSFISFGLSMVHFDGLSFCTGPVAAAFTWIYHLVLITKHNKACRFSDTSQYRLLWLNTHALIWGYALAILWTTAFSVILWRFIREFVVWDNPDNSGFRSLLIVSIFEMVLNFASAAVMWALVVFATHFRRTGKSMSEETQLQKRAGPREWVNEIQPQEQNRIGEV
ncbi:hypothetical protein DL96DRAFT_905413 [Flagelloscypha sp. PMI_526]|nr:hypothetical protein DL96DRAFT_905413 [Flagelloscypha sp. PMI_526]